MQKITLIGRLGRDAAIRETESGNKMVSFTMAVNGRFRGTEKTSWYDVSTFNYDRYRNMIKYLTKGSSVIVTGDLDADIEEGRDGVMRCRRFVTADSIEFNSSNSSGATKEERTETTTTRRAQKESAPDDIPDEELVVSPKRKAAKPKDEDDEPIELDETPKTAKRKPAPVEEEAEEEEVKPRKRKPAPVDDEDEDEELPF